MFFEPKGTSRWFILLCSLAHGNSTNASLLGPIILSLTGSHSLYVTLRTPQMHIHSNLLNNLLALSVAGHLLEQCPPPKNGETWIFFCYFGEIFLWHCYITIKHIKVGISTAEFCNDRILELKFPGSWYPFQSRISLVCAQLPYK